MIQSKALEINLARTQVDVTIDPKFTVLQEVMARYYGLLQGLEAFLKEVSHPFRNWHFIVHSARGYALDYFHLFKSHPRGPEAAQCLIDILTNAIEADTSQEIKIDAADNLILFLQKIIKSAEVDYKRFHHIVNRTFDFIYKQPLEYFTLFVRSFYSIKRLALNLLTIQGQNIEDYTSVNRLLIRHLQTTYADWLEQKDPHQWFLDDADTDLQHADLDQIFAPITHQRIASLENKLNTIQNNETLSAAERLQSLLQLEGHNDIVQIYRQTAQKLLNAGGHKHTGNQWKIIFLFHCMNISGLSLIHEDILRDINRSLQWLITSQQQSYIRKLIQKTFAILKTSTRQYPITALTCVLNMGQGIYQTKGNGLIDIFIEAVIDLGFQAPMIQGVGNDWQIRVNNAHLHNIRIWLALVELNPKQSKCLLSNLIIHLAVCGVFIKDTDLFGRDITQLLNSGVGPVYNLIKQLARLFPVYFNDIGAEGELRDISTQLDEICHRHDPLIHFLRKQSHVESSSRILGLMDAVLEFWATRDKSALAMYLPPNIFAKIKTKGRYINGVHRIITAYAQKGHDLPAGILNLTNQMLREHTKTVEGVSAIDRSRVMLFTEFYKLLNNKYNLDFVHIQDYLKRLPEGAFPEMHRLKEALAEPTLEKRIYLLLEYLELLKAIILSNQTYEAREDIYKKRHFTVDIPSMYGSYQEMKFDSMGLTLRLEALVNALFEDLINTIDLSLITRATCHQIYDQLELFNKALIIDGIASAELEHQLDLLAHSLEIRGFSFTQYLDIFKGFAGAVKNIINDYFSNIHGEYLTRILEELSSAEILKKYFPVNASADQEKLRYRISEIFFRDRLATSLGLQQLDLFLSRILTTLFHQSNRLPKEKLRLLLNYDSKKAVSALDNPNKTATGIIFLGNKGLNMLRLKHFDLPVPPAFIITTEVFRYQEIIDSFPPAEENFKSQVYRHVQRLQKLTGKHFGDKSNPLTVSVRSGSSISQPGMMDTLLNVGMNEEIATGLAMHSGNPWFAWDSYRRFMQCWGMTLGLERNVFDAIIADFKKRWDIPLKKGFTGAQMKKVALAYKQRILDQDFQIPEDPLTQLHQAIQMVMRSWESAKAKTYRRIMGISDDWGTTVTVQAMVFGNISQLSGTGVVFTHNPRWSGDSLSLWGDFTLENQGEDVVSGLVQTLPISIKQQDSEMRNTDITLETHFPDIYKTLKAWAQMLVYEKGWAPQEIEFTFEDPTVEHLYLLQTRDMAIRERKRVLTFDPKQKEKAVFLGHGIGVSGGAMSGRLVFSLEEVEHWRQKEPDTVLILMRGDTVPDDINEINATDGLLTARGGITSHASVVAHRLGKTCVVGCGNMICDEKTRIVRFGDIKLQSGNHISIDGGEGSVYQGLMKIKEA